MDSRLSTDQRCRRSACGSPRWDSRGRPSRPGDAGRIWQGRELQDGERRFLIRPGLRQPVKSVRLLFPNVNCGDPTLFSAIAALSPPNASFAAAEVKAGSPAIGRYSWFEEGSFRRISSASAVVSM